MAHNTNIKAYNSKSRRIIRRIWKKEHTLVSVTYKRERKWTANHKSILTMFRQQLHKKYYRTVCILVHISLSNHSNGNQQHKVFLRTHSKLYSVSLLHVSAQLSHYQWAWNKAMRRTLLNLHVLKTLYYPTDAQIYSS